MALLAVLSVIIIIFGVITFDTVSDQRDFIDQCIVERFTTMGQTPHGVKDYCMALWRLR